jgi:hypothetical protein
MRDRAPRAWTRSAGCLIGAAIALAALPTAASAQYSAPALTHEAIGEKYHAEVSGTLWNPSLFGVVSSEQFGIAGSNIDFTNDLGFTRTRFKDLRIVLRPSTKQKFRVEYTPVQYVSDTILNRSVVFNGINYPVSIPIQATFGWTVWRFGYEYDFFYRKRGYIGMFLEARYTTLRTVLNAPDRHEFSTTRVPLPAVGVAGRAYVAPNVAINFEVSGFCALQSQTSSIGVKCREEATAKNQVAYFDWNVYGTFNFTENVGAQIGWRRTTTLVDIKADKGNLKLQGIWFGAALRY